MFQLLQIAPSLLAADFAKLGEETAAMETAGAEMLHIDIMDGHFVPNISMGYGVVKCIRPHSKAVFDVHLMITDPVRYSPEFVKAGADIITFHLEAVEDPEATIKAIRDLGVKVGISVKPKTPASAVLKYLHMVDLILVMTVEPGFGGQKFMADMMPKLREISEYCKANGLDPYIEVDGGIDETTIKETVINGANPFVAGSSLFSKSDYNEAVKNLRASAESVL
ncbi:MAG: ribulose-phosphate 3-epimerase [Oscillospiraceae bacterium]|nr:ribulose-phosphate 3-epimerase [Oscillospiraceae bacterium]